MLYAETRDTYGDTQRAALLDTVAEVFAWYKDQGIDFARVGWDDIRECYTIVEGG